MSFTNVFGVDIGSLGKGDTSKNALKKYNESYCKTVGFAGTLVLIVSLGLSGLLVYLSYMITGYFRVPSLKRPEVFYFGTFAVLYALLFVFLIFKWKSLAKKALHDLFTRRRDTGLKQTALYGAWRKFLTHDGKAYVAKVFLFEAIENLNQCNNFIIVYCCNLPVEMTLACSFVLFLDATFRCKMNYGGLDGTWSMKNLNRELAGDCILDISFATLPILVTWFAFKIPLTPKEYFQLLWLPLIKTTLKLKGMFQQGINQNVLRYAVRLKGSIDKVPFHNPEKVAKAQVEYVGKKGFLIATCWSFIFAMIYAIMFTFQLVSFLNMRCDAVLWNDGCVVKIPFCGGTHAVEPSCNCVKLCLETHNMTMLPSDLFGPKNVSYLKVLNVGRGPLVKLPGDIVGLSSLVSVDIQNNALVEIPSFSTEKNPSLVWMYIMYNNVTSVPMSVWEHEYLVDLFLDGNHISEIPQVVDTKLVQKKSLVLLSVAGNNLTSIPPWIFDLPSLTELMVEKNRLSEIPSNIIKMKGRLKFFRISENRLSTLPDGFFDLGVEWLDLSHNMLRSSSFEVNEGQLPEHLYLTGNPVCNDTLALSSEWQKQIREVESYPHPEGCVEQCTKGCHDVETLNDICALECNVTECRFDGGACLESTRCVGV